MLWKKRQKTSPEAADAEEAGGNAEAAESDDEDEAAESTESDEEASYEEGSQADSETASDSDDEYSSDEQQIEEEDGEETSSGPAAEEAVQDDTAGDEDLQPETESQTEEVPAGMDSVFVTAVLGDSDDPISDAYIDVLVPVAEATLDLTESPIREEITRAVPVAGTQRLYVESFKYDYATIDGAQITSLAKKDITEDTVIYLHYSSAQIKTKYVYEDKDIKVTAVVQDPEVIPDNAILSVTQITEELNKVAFDAYMTALNNHSDQIAEQAAREEVSEYNAANTLLYDIAFLVPKADEEENVLEGQYVEIQPSGNAVSINMQFKGKQLSKELKAENTEDIQIVHLPIADSLAGTVDKTQDIIDGSEQELYTGEEIVESIVPETVDVQTANLTKKTENVEFETPAFSAYAVTLAAGNNFNLTVKVKFCDDEGNSINTDRISDDKRYYLVATTSGGQIDMGGWYLTPDDYCYYEEITPNGNSEYSMTINADTMARFAAVYWAGFHNENPLPGPYNGKTINIQVTETDNGGIAGHNYKSTEIGNGQKIGSFTLQMTGDTSRTLNWGSNEEIVIDAVKSGYKYEVQAYELDGVTPVSSGSLSGSNYVIAHVDGDSGFNGNNNVRYYVEPLDLSDGNQSGIISNFVGKWYHGETLSYSEGDNVVVELVSSDNMYIDNDHYDIDDATYYGVGSCIGERYTVDSITTDTAAKKTIIKLIELPKYFVKKQVVKKNEDTVLDTSSYYLYSVMENPDG